MVRENMRSPRAELYSILIRKKTSGVLYYGFDSRLVTRAVASHATGKGIDAPILHSVRVAHELEPPFPGLVSSVGRAHDSYDLRRSHERRRLLRSCGRGFNPRIGCKEFDSWLCGSTLRERSVPRKNARQTRVRVPARETTSKHIVLLLLLSLVV